MTNLADCNRKISEITQVLKAEIKQLRRGHFENIDQISTQKTQMTQALETLILKFSQSTQFQNYRPHLNAQLAQLKSISQENGLLLQAVSKGIKSAQNRLFILKNIQTQVGIYGRNGRAVSYLEDPASNEMKY